MDSNLGGEKMQYLNTDYTDNYDIPHMLFERAYKERNSLIIPLVASSVKPENIDNELFRMAYHSMEVAAEKCNIPVIPIYMFSQNLAFVIEMSDDDSMHKIVIRYIFRIAEPVSISKYADAERNKYLSLYHYCTQNGTEMENLESAYDFVIPGYECAMTFEEAMQIALVKDKIVHKKDRK